MPVTRILLAAMLLLAAGGELGGCGKKGDLKPPPGNEETEETG